MISAGQATGAILPSCYWLGHTRVVFRAEGTSLPDPALTVDKLVGILSSFFVAFIEQPYTQHLLGNCTLHGRLSAFGPFSTGSDCMPKSRALLPVLRRRFVKRLPRRLRRTSATFVPYSAAIFCGFVVFTVKW